MSEEVSLYWRTKGQSSVIRGIKSISRSMTRLDRDARTTTDNISASFKRLGATIGAYLATRQIVQFGEASITVAADFEQSMANVQSVAGASARELAKMTKAAEEMGATTAFKASEAADALYYLASAGLSADQATSSLKGVMLLAGATMSDLAFTSSAVVSTLAQFQMEASESGRVANVFAAAISGSQLKMELLAEAMIYAGAVSKSAGMSLEETTAAIGALANAGFQGSIGGTVLRGAISQLLAPSGEAAEVIKKLGLRVTDATGKFVGIVDIVRQLEKTGLDTADAMTLFGLRAGPGMVALVSQGADVVERLQKKITNTNKASEMYSTQMKTFEGSVKILGSSFEALQITLGNVIIKSDIGKSVVKSLTGALDDMRVAVKNNAGEMKTLIVVISAAWRSTVKIFKSLGKTAITAGKAIAAPFIAVIDTVFPGLSREIMNIIKDFKKLSKFIVYAFKTFEKSVAGFEGAFKLGFKAILAFGSKIFAKLGKVLADWLSDAATVAGTFSSDLEKNLTNAQVKVAASVVDLMRVSRESFREMESSAEDTADSISRIDDEIVSTMMSIDKSTSEANQSFDEFTREIEKTGDEIDATTEKVEQIGKEIDQTAKEMEKAGAEAKNFSSKVKEGFASITKESEGFADELGRNMARAMSGIGDVLGGAIASLISTGSVDVRKVAGALGSAIGAAVGASIGSAIMPGVGTALGAGLGGAIGGLAGAFGPGDEPSKWEKWAAGGREEIDGLAQSYQALLTDIKKVTQWLQVGHAEAFAVAIKQMGEIGREYLNLNDLTDRQRDSWMALTRQMESLGAAAEGFGLYSEQTTVRMDSAAQSASEYALNLAAAGQATHTTAQAAAQLAVALESTGQKISTNLAAYEQMITSLAAVDERMWGLANATQAVNTATAILSNAAMFSTEQIQQASAASERLTQIQARQSEIVNLLRNAHNMDAGAVEALRDEMLALNDEAKNIEKGMAGVTGETDKNTKAQLSTKEAMNATAKIMAKLAVSMGALTQAEADAILKSDGLSDSLAGGGVTAAAEETSRRIDELTRSVKGTASETGFFSRLADDLSRSLSGMGDENINAGDKVDEMRSRMRNAILAITDAQASSNRLADNMRYVGDKMQYATDKASLLRRMVASLRDRTINIRTNYIESYQTIRAAKGAMFPGGVRPFADGGVVSRPTYFRFANGVGLMGESGPEAILPLKRGRGGKLGVIVSDKEKKDQSPAPVHITLEIEGRKLADVLYDWSDRGELKIKKDAIVETGTV